MAVGDLGSVQSRLQSAYNVLATENLNITASNQRMADLDIADATAFNVRNEVRLETSCMVASKISQGNRLVLNFLYIDKAIKFY